MVMVSNIRVFFIFIVTKIECWPVFKQDPKNVKKNNKLKKNVKKNVKKKCKKM